MIHPGFRLVVEGRTGKKIYADRDRLEQVVINLISNAIKYSPRSKKVLIKLECDETSVMVHVKDYGIGIPKSDQSKIFERFYRVERPLHEGASGFGLGLYIAREVAKAHNGRIDVTSTANDGSSFTIRLPREALPGVGQPILDAKPIEEM